MAAPGTNKTSDNQGDQPARLKISQHGTMKIATTAAKTTKWKIEKLPMIPPEIEQIQMLEIIRRGKAEPGSAA
jgi:hypothetical protein